jgi:hypothetical protein
MEPKDLHDALGTEPIVLWLGFAFMPSVCNVYYSFVVFIWHYMFRHNRPSSGVQVVVITESAARGNAVLFFVCCCLGVLLVMWVNQSILFRCLWPAYVYIICIRWCVMLELYFKVHVYIYIYIQLLYIYYRCVWFTGCGRLGRNM